MATHDYIISNASGAAVRADLNNALAAIVSNNSNASSPSTTYAYQWWADTTTGRLKLRNSANSSWINIFELDGTMLMQNGTVSAPGLAFASDLDTGFFRSEVGKINFATGGVERLEIGSSEIVFNDGSNDVDFRVESNGNTHMLFVDGGNDRVGIGTSAPSNDIHLKKTGADAILRIENTGNGNHSGIFFVREASGGTNKGSANIHVESNTGSSGTALVFGCGNNISATGGERMRITSDGDINVHSTSAASATDPVTVDLGGQYTPNASITNANLKLKVFSNGANGDSQGLTASSTGLAYVSSVTTDHIFYTAPSSINSLVERMRIKSAGQTLFHSDSSHIFKTVRTGSTQAFLSFQNNASDIDSGTQVCRILADGDLENANNNYGALSDVKLKENIVDAGSQWEDLKAISVRNFNFKEELGLGTNTSIGVVAQELELVSPGLVKTSPDLDADENDLGTTTKSVKYSVLYMKAVKALQEAMTRIETLEAKVAALEAG